MREKNRHRIVTCMLTLLLCVGLMPALSVAVQAATVTSALTFAAGANQSGDGYDWNGTTKVLTLTDFTQQTAGARPLLLPADSILELHGTNKVTSTYSGPDETCGLYTSGAFVIRGNGSLELTGGSVTGGGTNKSYGLYNSTGATTIKSGVTIITRGGDSTGATYGYYGGSGTLTVEKDAVLEAYAGVGSGATNSQSMGVRTTVEIYGKVIAVGNSSGSNQSYGIDTNSYGVAFRAYVGSDVTAKGYNGAIYGSEMGFNPAAVTASSSYNGGLQTGVITVVGANRNGTIKIDGDSALYARISPESKTLDFTNPLLTNLSTGTGNSGSYAWSTNLLTLNNFVYNTQDPITIIVPNGVTINVNGNCAVKSAYLGADGYGIKGVGSVNIKSTAGGTLDVSGSAYGIYAGALSLHLDPTSPAALNGLTARGGTMAFQGYANIIVNRNGGYMRASMNYDGSNIVTDEGVSLSGGIVTANHSNAKYFVYSPYYDENVVEAASDSNDVDVQAKITDASLGVYKVDIAWGAMTFEWNTSGIAYNPDTHEYEIIDGDGEWTAASHNGFNNRIVCANHSNGSLLATFDVSGTLGGVTYDVFTDNDVKDTAATDMSLPKVPNETATAPEIEAYLWLSGEPDSVAVILNDVWKKVGVITVTFTPDMSDTEKTPKN